MLPAAAFFLDLVLGDPSWLPHPVRWMGRLISELESRWLDKAAGPGGNVRTGTLLAVVVTGATFLAVLALQHAAFLLHPLAGKAVELVFLYTALAARGLSDAALAIHRLLAAGDITAARQAVSMVVGRDTEQMSAGEAARAAVETVAENTVDGVTAPLFYALLGGAPLALAYKAVNTLDSMLGYRNERYLYFGRTAARLDDAANWLPARVTVPVMWLAACLLRLDAREGWRTFRRDGRRHPSPNSGLAEAFTAGALRVTLGGENRYGGVVSARPRLGTGRATQAGDIAVAVKLMHVTSLLFLLMGLTARFLLIRAWGGN